jgi:hypothetical protein
MEAIDTTTVSFQPEYLNVVANDIFQDSPGREGGDDAISESSPNDSRLDEKVIVNEQRSNKTVNAPSQTAANTSEDNASDDELIDEDLDVDKETKKEKRN